MLFEIKTQIERKVGLQEEAQIEAYRMKEREIEGQIKGLETTSAQAPEGFSEGDSARLLELNKRIDEVRRRLGVSEEEKAKIQGSLA